MRILVLSDCHNRLSGAKDALDRESDATAVFYLGDGLDAMRTLLKDYPNLRLYAVAGNCDRCMDEPLYGIEKIGGHTIFYTHGHLYGVKSGTERLLEISRNLGADLCLYGHTHIPDIDYRGGVILLNPGSVSLGRTSKNTYAVIDITSNGLIPSIKVL